MKAKFSAKDLLQTFLVFFKLGIFSIGGGTTMLTLLQDELVERKHWIDNDELMEMTAISESTPGPIAINLATYLGYKRCGFLGALLATLGVVITPFVLMFCISLFLEKILAAEAIQYAFMGIKAGVVFLLLKVSYTLIKGTKKDLFLILTLVIVTIAMVLFTVFAIDFSAIYFILLGAVIGLLIYGVIPRRKGGKK
ncbi:MAG: chromate transporter [Bacilli bacterium]|nr:chromate transporter [Bacilli bacterium]